MYYAVYDSLNDEYIIASFDALMRDTSQRYIFIGGPYGKPRLPEKERDIILSSIPVYSSDWE